MNCISCETPMRPRGAELFKCDNCELISSNLPFKKEVYGKKYLENYNRLTTTSIGEKINKERWNLVKSHIEGGHIMDYGAGAGHFINLNPNGTFLVSGFEINPYSLFSFLSPFSKKYTYAAVTLWDVIEHLPDPIKTLSTFSFEWLFLTTPNVDAAPKDIRKWYHHKPDEHLHYFNQTSLCGLMDKIGMEVVDYSYIEGRLRNPTKPKWLLTMAAKRR
jgi:hypothetical protein